MPIDWLAGLSLDIELQKHYTLLLEIDSPWEAKDVALQLLEKNGDRVRRPSARKTGGDARYAANRLRVVRQVKYSLHNENCLDVVLFLNGITGCHGFFSLGTQLLRLSLSVRLAPVRTNYDSINRRQAGRHDSIIFEYQKLHEQSVKLAFSVGLPQQAPTHSIPTVIF